MEKLQSMQAKKQANPKQLVAVAVLTLLLHRAGVWQWTNLSQPVAPEYAFKTCAGDEQLQLSPDRAASRPARDRKSYCPLFFRHATRSNPPRRLLPRQPRRTTIKWSSRKSEGVSKRERLARPRSPACARQPATGTR